VRYYRPATGNVLPLAPVLESWDRAGNSSQTRLNAFLTSVEGQLRDLDPSAPLALSLTVGLPSTSSLTTGGRDLDNYLLPVVRRLGHERFFAVFGQKVHGDSSTLAVERIRELADDSWVPQMKVRTTSSAQSPAWKHEVAAACGAAAPQNHLAGALALEIHYRLSAGRNWAQLWKPTIDALGAVLGVPNPMRPFAPNDDRLVSLALSRSVDETLGWGIEVLVRWSQV
jgi:Holliday junction resolvase RusA-like endonuclease